jgi:hypothetical protein
VRGRGERDTSHRPAAVPVTLALGAKLANMSAGRWRPVVLAQPDLLEWFQLLERPAAIFGRDKYHAWEVIAR